MFKKSKLAIVISGLMLLSACGGSSDNSPSTETGHDHHDHQHGDNIGRLAISEKDTTTVHILDIKGRTDNPVTLAFKPTALYASPEYRYLLAFSRTLDGKVEVVDGGLSKKPHNDHFDTDAKAPASKYVISYANPTHYRVNNKWATIWFDADGASGIHSKVLNFNDALLAQGESKLRHQNFTQAVHGVAEPIQDNLLITHRTGTEGLPDKVRRYHYHSDHAHYHQEQEFAATCPSLHGSTTAGSVSAFGCEDGVLVVTQQKDGTFSDQKLSHSVRITGIQSAETSQAFAAWGKDGKLYSLNVKDASKPTISSAAKDWANGGTAARKASLMDDEGGYYLVLDATGTVHVLDAKNDFAYKKAIKVFASPLGTDTSVSMVASPRNDDVYIVNSDAKQIAVLNLHELALEEPIKLTFTPEKLAWLGFTGEAVSH